MPREYPNDLPCGLFRRCFNNHKKKTIVLVLVTIGVVLIVTIPLILCNNWYTCSVGIYATSKSSIASSSVTTARSIVTSNSTTTSTNMKTPSSITTIKSPSLQFVFDNYRLNRSVNVTGVSNGGYRGFGMSSSNPIRYFVTHHDQHKIFVFDEGWNCVSNKSSFPFVNYMISVGYNFYITGWDYVWKTDLDFSVSITHYNLNAYYRGLYYNSTNDLIYVLASNLQGIYVFDVDLTLTDSFPTAPYTPWSLNEYKNQLYVGTRNGTIIVILNKQIINKFDGCNGQITTLCSILFDQFDNMATGCYYDGQLYLYNRTGSYLNKTITVVDAPEYMGFDSKSRLVAVTWAQIKIYN